jgi:copper chaperone CopZ
MKTHLMTFLIILLIPVIGNSQEGLNKTDSTISFRVYGNCEQCRDRIEGALKIKGIHSASWDMVTQLLNLSYNPKKISIDKIKNKIAAVGHDLEDRKAANDVYQSLPACCKYRKDDKMISEIQKSIEPVKQDENAPAILKGVVLEADQHGDFHPLPGASVSWLGTGTGTFSDSTGIFSIRPSVVSNQLVVSYTGYTADTIGVSDLKDLKIILASGKSLAEVIVSSKLHSTYINSINPLRTQVMTEKELFKAACCNLSESFETNPSVDVSYNDAVTGSKQIQLLGLSGVYTQLTMENLPGPRGLSTPLGLNAVSGTWIESIQLSKGIGSVANGFESIAGQINVELKKPGNTDKLFLNLFTNDLGKTDLNVNLHLKAGKKWNTLLLLHDDFFTDKKADFNKDGFRDQPYGSQFSLANRWKFDNAHGLLVQFGASVFNNHRTGGQLYFNPATEKHSTIHYGLGIHTDRYEAYAKIGYVFPNKKYKSIGLQLSTFNHDHVSYFGLTDYNGNQQNFYANLIYQSIIGSTVHKFRTGIGFIYDRYDEKVNMTSFKRKEMVPGVFFEYTWTPVKNFNAVVGIRGDHNNLFGSFLTPRLHIRYEPVKGTVIRLSAGRGQRTANIFAENLGLFASSRIMLIQGNNNNKNGYGLDPEIAWNKGIAIDQKLKLFEKDATLSVDFFRTDFKDQVIVDIETAGQAKFYNLGGKSYSNSFQAQLNVEPLEKFDIRLAYRYLDVKSTFGKELLSRPLMSGHRAFINLEYELAKWKFDYTVNYNSRKRIPPTIDNPVGYRFEEYSPSFIVMNAHITRSFGKKRQVDVYIGCENLNNFVQEDLIIAPGAPFSPYFDASLVWGPVEERMFYGGIRFRLK